MAKKPLTKKALTRKELLDQIESKIQELNLLQSALKSDRSRKPEMVGDYLNKFNKVLGKK